MNKGPWEGCRIDLDRKVLILGESHYDDKDFGQPVSYMTSGVVEYYLEQHEHRERWEPFFDKIAKSFGYDRNHARDFYDQVCYGNYIDVLCGKRDGTAKRVLANEEYRTECNNGLFTYLNDNGIGTVVCFSELVYRKLPSLSSSSEMQEWVNLGRISPAGRTHNWAEHCNYVPGIAHEHCDVLLQQPLKVYRFRHPSCLGGYNPEQVFSYIQKQPVLCDICRM